jgi:hypothetical protein
LNGPAEIDKGSDEEKFEKPNIVDQMNKKMEIDELDEY